MGVYMMKYKVLVLSITFILLISGGIGIVDGKEYESREDFEKIYDWYDLDEIREDLDGKYILMNDLDENTDGYDELMDTEEGWEPIGDEDDPFSGTFNPNGNKIRYPDIDRDDERDVRLFGEVEDTQVLEMEKRYDEGEIYDRSTEEENTLLNVEEIHDWYDLYEIRENLDGEYILMNDLDENTDGYEDLVDTEYGWDPIGDENNPFTGTFDGDGHEIEDLEIDRDERIDVGLFGYMNEDGEIRNIGVTAIDINGYQYVGGLVGYNLGRLVNSYAEVDINGNRYVGGLVGFNGGDVEQSYSTGEVRVTGGGDGDSYSGGLIGYNGFLGYLSSSYSTAEISVRGGGNRNNYIGGLIGYNAVFGFVVDTYSTGEVSVRGGGGGENYEGGLIGYNPIGIVINSYWNTETSGLDHSAGGEGRTTEEMTWEYAGNTYINWDFENTWLDGDHEFVEDHEGNTGYPALREEDEDPPEMWISADDDILTESGSPGDTIKMNTSVSYNADVEIDIITSLEGDFGEIDIENLAVKSEEMDEFVYFQDHDDTIPILEESEPDEEEQLNITWKVDIPFGASADTYDITVIYQIGESGTLYTSEQDSEQSTEEKNTVTRNLELSTAQPKTQDSSEVDFTQLDGSSIIDMWVYLMIVGALFALVTRKIQRKIRKEPK